MVQDSAHIRRRGAQDFASYYNYACARQDTMPLPAVMTNLLKGQLDFNGDRVKLTDWAPILSSISINKHLYHIAISSTYQVGLGAGDTDRRYYKSCNRKKIPPIRSKDMTFKLCKALQDCVTASPNLKSLHINGLPLRERDLNSLTKGLAKSVSLEKLSLANCPISDEGLEVICQSVKYTTCIKTVDFTSCNLTWRGAEHMANIIKHQGLWRHSTAWAESLRYRRPEFEGMGGLRRITLNCNSLIGDRGAAALAHELGEDLWVKAVDLQKCGLSDQGAQCLLEALKINSTLNVLDIRSNPLIDKVLIKSTIEKVLKNSDGQTSEYYWIKPPVPKETQKAPGARRRAPPNAAKRKATFRIAPRGGAPAGRWSPGVSQQQLHRSRPACVPWRTAARAERQRCLSPCIAGAEQGFQGAATVKVTIDSSSEEEAEEEEEVVVVKVTKSPSPVDLHDRVTRQQYQLVQMELEQCRRSLAEERRARLRAESQLREHELETSRLRSLNHSLSEALAGGPGCGPAALAASRALEDEAVLQSIESSFTKFHAFLDLLKDAGLGQLASVAGIDQSDFGLLSRPQLSSTMGQPLDEAASVSKGGLKRAVSLGAKIDAAVPLEANPLTVPSEDQAPAFPPGTPAAPREFLSGRRLSQASGPAIDPCVDLEGRGEEPDQFSKPDTQQDSGSEGSFRSQKSYSRSSRDNKGYHVSRSHEEASRSANHHSNGNSPHSHSHSHHSNGSHRYSLSYSSFHSGGSLRSRSIGDRSQRSSLSDLASEKLESEGSFTGSKGKEAGRRVPAGLSGPGELPGRSCPRPEAVEQTKFLGVLSGGSEDGSF